MGGAAIPGRMAILVRVDDRLRPSELLDPPAPRLVAHTAGHDDRCLRIGRDVKVGVIVATPPMSITDTSRAGWSA